MEQKVKRIGKKSLSILLVAAIIAAMIPMMITPALAVENSTLENAKSKLAGYKADADALYDYLLEQPCVDEDCPNFGEVEECEEWTHRLLIPEEEYTAAIEKFKENIDRDLQIINDLETGVVTPGLPFQRTTGTNDGQAYYNSQYNTEAKRQEAALYFLNNGGFHCGDANVTLTRPTSVKNWLAYRSSFTSYTVSFTTVIGYTAEGSRGEKPIIPEVEMQLDILRIGATIDNKEIVYNYMREAIEGFIKRAQKLNRTSVPAGGKYKPEEYGPAIDSYISKITGDMERYVSLVSGQDYTNAIKFLNEGGIAVSGTTYKSAFHPDFSNGILGLGANKANVFVIMRGTIDALERGSPYFTQAQLLKMEYEELLAEVEALRDDEDSILAILRNNDDLDALLKNIKTLLGSLAGIKSIIATIDRLGIGTDVIDPILGQFGMSYDTLKQVVALGDTLADLNIDLENGSLDSLMSILGPIASGGITLAITTAKGLAAIGDYTGAISALKAVYDILGPLNEIMKIIDTIGPYLSLLDTGIALVVDVLLLYEQVTGLISNFSVISLREATLTLEDTLNKLADILDILREEDLLGALSGLFNGGGIGDAVSGGLSGLLNGWLTGANDSGLGSGLDLGPVGDAISGLTQSLLGNTEGLANTLRAAARVLGNAAGLMQGGQDLYDSLFKEGLNFDGAMAALITMADEFTKNNLIGNTVSLWNELTGLFSGALPAGFTLAPEELFLVSEEAGVSSKTMLAPLSGSANVKNTAKQTGLGIQPAGWPAAGTYDPLTDLCLQMILEKIKDTARVLCDSSCILSVKQEAVEEFLSYMRGVKGCIDELWNAVKCMKDAVEWAKANLTEQAAREFADKLACLYTGRIIDCFKGCKSSAALADAVREIRNAAKEISDILKLIMCAGKLEITATPTTGDGYYDLSTNYDDLIAQLRGVLDYLGVKFRYKVEPPEDALFKVENDKLKNNDQTPPDGEYGVTIAFCVKICGCSYTLATKTVPVTIESEPEPVRCRCEKCEVCGGCLEKQCCNADDCDCEPCTCNIIVQPVSYTVRFYVDGRLYSEQSVIAGGAATDPNPGRAGYTFSGWDKAFSNITSNLDVYGTFAINTYTVTFYVDNAVYDVQTVVYGGAATDPNPGRAGYTFSGWDKAFSYIISNLNVYGTFTYAGAFYYGGRSEEIELEDLDVALADMHAAYIEGYGNGTIRPNDFIRRSEVAMIMWRLLPVSMQLGGESGTFKDVADGTWYADAVNCLAGLGIIKGYSDGTFKPNTYITRQEFTAMAFRFFEAAEGDYDNPFPDVDESLWAYKEIVTAAGLGWILGYTNGTFKPKDNIKRSEAVSIINRILERKVLKENIPEEYYTLYSDLTPSHWAFADILEASVTHFYEIAEDGTELWVIDDGSGADEVPAP